MKNAVIRDVTLCGSPILVTLMMVAILSYEPSHVASATQHNTPEDILYKNTVHIARIENKNKTLDFLNEMKIKQILNAISGQGYGENYTARSLIVFIIYRVYGKQKIVSLLNQLSTTP
jgi:hypothetical protein